MLLLPVPSVVSPTYTCLRIHNAMLVATGVMLHTGSTSSAGAEVGGITVAIKVRLVTAKDG